jgi:D-proline reductase (dithiol) PrdB
VGLVARKIEEAGIPTVTINLIWEFQRALGMPRVAALEHPFGRPYGEVDDRNTQSAVLRAALELFGSAQQPDHVEHLDFVWHEEPKRTRWHPPEPAPIIRYMKEQGKI